MNITFARFLKKGGRSGSAAQRVQQYVREFETYLQTERHKSLADVTDGDLQGFVDWIEQQPKASAKGYLWGLRYYFEYTSDEALYDLAGMLRQARIKRRPFAIRDFRGVDAAAVEKLAAADIRNIEQMLEAGKTPAERAALAEQTGLTDAAILELVKLSDLARVPGIKGMRARLYHDAGINTLEKLAACDPDELLRRTTAFVEQTNFDGIPPLPAEIRYSIEKARQLPNIVEY